MPDTPLMSRPPRIPPSLIDHPFTVQEAQEAGISPISLRGRAWRRVGHGIYVAATVPDEPRIILPLLTRLLPEGAVYSRRSGAALCGLPLPYRDPIEITVPLATCSSKSRYFNQSRAALEPDDVTSVEGAPVTKPARTLADLSLTFSLVETVVQLDAALHAGITTEAALAAMAVRRAGRPGAERFRRALELSDGKAESPPESRVRVQIVTAGLPPPEVQADLTDHHGRFLARADLYYPDLRLVIEYDGDNHRDRLQDDNRRQNLLLAAGYGILRLTAADLRAGREAIAQQVRAARAGRRARAA